MAPTLTLGTTAYSLTDGDYALTNGTSFNTSSGFAATATPLSATNSATIKNGPVSNVAVDLGAGYDTLVINTTMTGAQVNGNFTNSVINAGAGNDSVVVNSAVSNYRIDGSSANDTLVINANLTGVVLVGGTGADSIRLASGTFTNSQISAAAANDVANITDGNDTINIAAETSSSGVFITNFSKANDTLIIGGTTLSGSSFSNMATGVTYTATNYPSTAGANAVLAAWLQQGTGNGITLI
jgi:Ca2+-binding RTX toxin-like protein